MIFSYTFGSTESRFNVIKTTIHSNFFFLLLLFTSIQILYFSLVFCSTMWQRFDTSNRIYYTIILLFHTVYRLCDIIIYEWNLTKLYFRDCPSPTLTVDVEIFYVSLYSRITFIP